MMKCLFSAFYFFFFGAQIVCAQNVVDLSSPRASVRTFLQFTSAADYGQAAVVFYDPSRSASELSDLAYKFKQTLDATGHIIYTETLPDKDSTYTLSHYAPLKSMPNIYLEEHQGMWVFSAEAVRAIELWHQKVFPFGAAHIVEFMPQITTHQVGPFQIWQLMFCVLCVLFSLLLQRILQFICVRVVMHVLHRQAIHSVSQARLTPTVRALSWGIVLLFFLSVFPILQLPLQIAHYTRIFISVLLPVLFGIALYRATDIIYFYLKSLSTTSSKQLSMQLLVLLTKISKVGIVILSGFFALNALKIPFVHLLTGLSLGGLALALAAQDTIKNFFGSLMIFVDRPFRIGDWISCEQIEGVVEDVGLRSTRIRTFTDSVIYVPNVKLADNTINNHGLRKYRRYYTNLYVPYDTSSALIKRFIKALKVLVEQHALTRKDAYEVHVHNFDREGVRIMFYIFIKAENWTQELETRHAINLSIIEIAEKLNINFSYRLDVSLTSYFSRSTKTDSDKKNTA